MEGNKWVTWRQEGHKKIKRKLIREGSTFKNNYSKEKGVPQCKVVKGIGICVHSHCAQIPMQQVPPPFFHFSSFYLLVIYLFLIYFILCDDVIKPLGLHVKRHYVIFFMICDDHDAMLVRAHGGYFSSSIFLRVLSFRIRALDLHNLLNQPTLNFRI